MKLKIEDKEYGFVWGTATYEKTIMLLQKFYAENELNLDVNLDFILASLGRTEVFNRLVFCGLNTWCDKNDVERPFSNVYDFLLEFDGIVDNLFLEAVFSDILDSTTMGEPVLEYIERVHGQVLSKETVKKGRDTKKKYLSNLEKSSSNSAPTASTQKKSNIRQLKST
ncbi:MAG TPA: hypothetical protein VNR38_00855 [Ureibacillus sp.]|nr:hypothetical protein [Ureibacillus sp.]